MNAKTELTQVLKAHDYNWDDIHAIHVSGWANDFIGKTISITFVGSMNVDADYLDFEYEPQYDDPSLFGFVLLKDGTWFDRVADYLERWEHQSAVTIDTFKLFKPTDTKEKKLPPFPVNQGDYVSHSLSPTTYSIVEKMERHPLTTSVGIHLANGETFLYDDAVHECVFKARVAEGVQFVAIRLKSRWE